jgi:hypothetical protein
LKGDITGSSLVSAKRRDERQRSLPKTRINPTSRVSAKLASLMGASVVGLHQGPRTNAPHQQAGHMTAADQIVRSVKKVLAIGGRPHTTIGVPIASPPASAAISWKSSRSHGRGSILITSQFPVPTWHDVIGEPTLGDATPIGSNSPAHRCAYQSRPKRASLPPKPQSTTRRRSQEMTRAADLPAPVGRRESAPRRARVPPIDYGDGLVTLDLDQEP